MSILDHSVWRSFEDNTPLGSYSNWRNNRPDNDKGSNGDKNDEEFIVIWLGGDNKPYGSYNNGEWEDVRHDHGNKYTRHGFICVRN